jgi:hypothetical protein
MLTTDGWLGTRDLPGYRAGNVVARLADLPQVDSQHLYFDLVLLDGEGQLRDNHSGPCYVLARERSPDERSRFVRIVAEFVRHAPTNDRGLSGIGQTLSLIRERGIERDSLVLAAQLLDDVCTERAVVASLSHMLELLLGEDEAQHTMRDVVAKLERETDPLALVPVETDANDHEDDQSRDSGAGLKLQVAYVVRAVGKTRARRYLREATDFEIVPTPEMFGI